MRKTAANNREKRAFNGLEIALLIAGSAIIGFSADSFLLPLGIFLILLVMREPWE